MLYFGRPGALVALPSPRRGLDATWVRQSTVKSTLGGGQVAMFAPGGRRTIKASWASLPYDTYAQLEEWYTGQRGPGPWVLLDTARRNHLSRNQASATSAELDASGWSVTAGSGEAVTSNADAYQRGPRSARWTLPATVTSGVLELDPPPGLVGVPTPAGRPWSWSGVLMSTGIAPSVTVTPVLSWRRVDGSEVSITSGTPVAATPGGWATYAVSASAPPAGAVAVRAQLRVTPGALTTAAVPAGPLIVVGDHPARRRARVDMDRSKGLPAGGRRARVRYGYAPTRRVPAAPLLVRAPDTSTDVLIDRPQLEMAAAASAWAPGTGVPLVSWLSLSDVATYTTYRMPIEAVWVEVG